MALVLRKIHEQFSYYYDIKDPRTENFFLLESFPWSLIALISLYLALTKFGPEFMKNRQPYKLNNVMMCYNLLQVVANFALAIYGYHYVLFVRKLELICAPIDYSNSSMGLTETKLSYYYMLLKVLDLLDTVFMVLRKNFKQISFLHVYHHANMVIGVVIGVGWIPGGAALWLGFVNVFVHGIMYFYYFLTAFQPELKKSIWWKKNLTQIQMIQFIFMTIIFGIGALRTDCKFPRTWLTLLGLQNGFMFLMFGDFYRRSYLKTKKN